MTPFNPLLGYRVPNKYEESFKERVDINHDSRYSGFEGNVYSIGTNLAYSPDPITNIPNVLLLLTETP